MMRNPFTRRPRTPDAATLHARQQAATLRGELQQAHTIIMALRSENAQLRAERDEAQENYEFYFDEYRRNCAAGGKHQ